MIDNTTSLTVGKSVAIGYFVEWYLSIIACCIALPIVFLQVIGDNLSSRLNSGPVRIAIHWVVAFSALILSIITIDPSQVWGRLPSGITSLFYNNIAGFFADGWAIWTYHALRTHYRHLNQLTSIIILKSLLVIICSVYTIATNIFSITIMITNLNLYIGINNIILVLLITTCILVACFSYISLRKAVLLIITNRTRDYWTKNLRRLLVFVVATIVLCGGSGILTIINIQTEFTNQHPTAVNGFVYQFNTSLFICWIGVLFGTIYSWMPLTGLRWGRNVHICIRTAGIEPPTRYVFVNTLSPKMSILVHTLPGSIGSPRADTTRGSIAASPRADRRTSASFPNQMIGART